MNLNQDYSVEKNIFSIDNLLGMGCAGYVYKVDDSTAAKLMEIAPNINGLNGAYSGIKEVELTYLGDNYLSVDDTIVFLQDHELRRLCHVANEAEMLESVLDIENVVNVKDHKFLNYLGSLYSVIEMDYLPGKNLKNLLESGSSIRDLAKAMTDTSEVLLSLEQKRIIHRDVKPGNIIYTPSSWVGEGKTTLIDFGLAIGEDDCLPCGLITGTPGYLSPEQVRNEKLTTKSDFFSLGATAIKCFTGRSPFPSYSADEPEYSRREKLSNLLNYNLNKKNDILESLRSSNYSDDLINAVGFAMDEIPQRRRILPLMKESFLLANYK